MYIKVLHQHHKLFRVTLHVYSKKNNNKIRDSVISLKILNSY